MRSKRFFVLPSAVLALLTTVFSMPKSTSAQETVLVKFNNTNGNAPIAGLVSDSHGNLYGTTSSGGTYGGGTIFKLTPEGNGWVQSILYSFDAFGYEAYWPNSRVLLDASGNIYGTTLLGGDYGVGTVYEASPAADGTWTAQRIHNFDIYGGDGTYPHGGLSSDASGNIYGTAAGGGDSGDGIVYKLSLNSNGDWTETVLHSFDGSNGASPYSSLVLDGSGNLYGTTGYGGRSSACNTGGCGTVFELSPNASGGWTETALIDFNYADGANPFGGLVFDNAGNLYGSASQGGPGNFGLIFELSPVAGGGWKESILHRFTRSTDDAINPQNPLVFDAAGNLYGTAQSGGVNGKGAVFELTSKSGPWSEKVLYSFTSSGNNGYPPTAGIVLDATGNIYGSTVSGGDNSACLDGCGTVFKINPRIKP